MTGRESRPSTPTGTAHTNTLDVKILPVQTRCRECRHPLYAKRSVARGIGPICSARHRLEVAA